MKKGKKEILPAEQFVHNRKIPKNVSENTSKSPTTSKTASASMVDASEQTDIPDEQSSTIPDVILDKWIDNFKGLQPDSYWLTRIILLRAIAFIFCVAFLVAFHQNKQLIGDSGLLPLRLHMKNVAKRAGDSWWSRITAAPTIFWLAEPWTEVDSWLDTIALSGFTLSLAVFISGAANFFIMITLWVLYHSLVAVGQTWYSFGWESQLLETGLLITWGVSLMKVESLSFVPPSFVTIYGLRWLLFRIMLGAGLIKIRGDACWRDFTCMDYHYETQPVPNPMAYYLHHTPSKVHMLEVLGNHIVELVIPWFAAGNRMCQMICGVSQILFQIILIISGNLSFLNWLTIVPSLALFDDRFYSRLFSRETCREVARRQILEEKEHPITQPGFGRNLVNACLFLALAFMSVPVVINLLSSRQVMNTSYDPFRILNTYGAFGSVTKERHEVILEGLASNGTWLEYEFNCKPGKIDHTPCIISPYHYRLDWLMWFAGMQRSEDNPWLFHLSYKLLNNDPTATELIRVNPFTDGDPPSAIRGKLYRYHYTEPFTNAKAWYRRRVSNGGYLRELTLENLTPVVKRMGWL